MDTLTTQLEALFVAIQGSNVQQVRHLLAANVSPIQCNADGKTALMVAAQIGNPEIIQILCAAIASQPRSTPIFFEPSSKEASNVELMLSSDSALPSLPSAVPTFKVFIPTASGFADMMPSPIEPVPAHPTFANGGALQSVSQNAPADVLANSYTDDLDNRDSLNNRDLKKNSFSDLNHSLESAVCRNDLNAVKVLLASGASLRPITWYDTPVLVTAAAKGYADIVQALLIAGANANSGYDRLPLHVAAEHGHLNVVQYLLNSGACLQDREENGRTALMSAAAGGHLSIVQILVSRGADVNAACQGETAMIIASQNGHQAVSQFLASYSYR